MGKKKASGKTYTSRGERPSVSKKTRNATRQDYEASPYRILNQLRAHRAGRNTVVTIPNPNKEETNRPFIRVSGKDFFSAVKK